MSFFLKSVYMKVSAKMSAMNRTYFTLCLFVVCFSHFLPLERLGGLESHVKVAMV